MISCQKNTENPAATGITVSGKIKKITSSNPSAKKAEIKTFEYDASNRIGKVNYWMEDHARNPVTITYQAYSTLYYDGSNQFPSKTVTQKGPGAVDTTIYFYDTQNKIIQEDFRSGNQLTARYTYSYLSAGIIVKNYYVPIGSTPQLQTSDSLLYDFSNKITEIRSYSSNGTLRGIISFIYDSKTNPLSGITAFAYINSLHTEDYGLYNKAPNNVTKIVDNQLSAGTYITNYNLNYSANSFPINGTSTTNTTSTVTSITYEYY